MSTQAQAPKENGAAPREHEPARLLGVRVTAILEIVAFIAITLAIDHFYFDGDRFFDTRPHPFWMIVVLVAVQYGANEGLLAALAASAALLLFNLPVPALDQDVFDYWTDVGLRPALWVGVGQILGQIRSREVAERDKLRATLAATESRAQVLANSFDELKKAKSALEARIARQFRTVITTYRAAQSIDVTDAVKLEAGLDQLIEAVLSPRKYSLWLLGADGFTLDRTVGWAEHETFEREFDIAHPVVQHLLARQPALCSARADDERKLMGQGLLAGALTDVDSGEIVGMLKIEEASFLDFNLYTLENFNVICSWLGAARVRARVWQTLQRDRVTGINDLLMTEEVFDRIVDLLARLGARKGFESTMLSVRYESSEGLGPEQRSMLALAVGEATRTTFRSTDLAFERETEEAGFAILLPGTPLDHAETLATKMHEAVRGRLAPALSAEAVIVEAHPLTGPGAVVTGGRSEPAE